VLAWFQIQSLTCNWGYSLHIYQKKFRLLIFSSLKVWNFSTLRKVATSDDGENMLKFLNSLNTKFSENAFHFSYYIFSFG